MAKALPELTQRQIQKVWKTTDQSRREIALQFGVSESTVKRLTQGIPRDSAAGAAVVGAAIAHGAAVTIDGVPIGRYVADTIAALAAELPTAPAKSKEGVAGALLKYLEFYAKLNPQRLEDVVDQLLAHPDFSLEAVRELITRRYAG